MAPRTTLLDSVKTILQVPLTRARAFETVIEPVKTAVRFCLVSFAGGGKEEVHLYDVAGSIILIGDKRPTRIVFDPIFAERASPTTWFGPRRYLAAPCAQTCVADAGEVSYDHLDIESLRSIHTHWPEVHFFVPLGVKSILLGELELEEMRISELDWWDTVSFPSSSTTEVVEFVCTPAQHNSEVYWTNAKPSGPAGSSGSSPRDPSPSSEPETKTTPSASIYFAGYVQACT
ncbi:N-acyl-phosphatidylethanolamine-hydrolyzing phospholipase D [Hypsizygus marmoreus]|uniref:N-acyl-phosphatidylethanolamine-hydrolyzing phospholipase D n=1 Tax=Hypsizygus marmoreus TaxID=39966 RepID=A0A369KGT2_HYPMA|nr:N-acyl-phosphatidylethanolamine-hydrolyzing phospholipase D [Hypsizygus marmoreus]